MWTPWSHSSPFSTRAWESFSWTLASRRDFTSDPTSTIPHSNSSRISKSWRALRFWATGFGPGGAFAVFVAMAVTVPVVLRLSATAYAQMIGHCYDGLPLEACGLLAGPPGSDDGAVCFPTRNDAASSRVYTVNPMDFLKADRAAEAQG